MIRRTILEWDTIRYGEAADEMPTAAADRIVAVAAASPLAGRGGGGVIEHGRKGLRARGVVGVIARRAARWRSCQRSTSRAWTLPRRPAASAAVSFVCWRSKQGVSQVDVYQMMAYGRLYRCGGLTLLYPHHAGLESVEGMVASHRINGSDERLDTATIDVARSGEIASRLRKLVAHDDAMRPGGAAALSG